MKVHDSYELVDFGDGRKLERFAGQLVDRPAPAAESCERMNRAAWREATLRYRRLSADRGQWEPSSAAPKEWYWQGLQYRLQLKLTPFGHLGIFPEQRDNWRWIGDWMRRQRAIRPDETPSVLNLFAYTGGSTLAAAAAGAAVTHVDAARNVVTWARHNAQASQLAAAPIRWIVEDALRFIQREVRRGRRYHGIVLDPPSYGHGPQQQAWKLSRDLPALLEACHELIEPAYGFVLFTAHSEGMTREEAHDSAARIAPSQAEEPQVEWMGITARTGHILAAGIAARTTW